MYNALNRIRHSHLIKDLTREVVFLIIITSIKFLTFICRNAPSIGHVCCEFTYCEKLAKNGTYIMNFKIIRMASYHSYLDYEICSEFISCPFFFFLLSLFFWTREKAFCICCNWIPSFQTIYANFAIFNPSSNTFHCLYYI